MCKECVCMHAFVYMRIRENERERDEGGTKKINVRLSDRKAPVCMY